MRAPGVVIVGTGRSGSGYIACVLREAGVPCGHESVWNPWGTKASGLVADSSWCALALGLGRYRGTVLYQLRDPLAVVTSLARLPTTEGPYLDLQRRLVARRLLRVPDDDLAFAVAATLVYQREALDRAEWGWHVEDVDPPRVQAIGAAAGLAVSRVSAEVALDAVPRDWNRHHDDRLLDWGDLPDLPVTEALYLDARAEGYA